MRYYDRIATFGTSEQKVEQIIDYLYQLTDILNYNLESSSPEGIWKATNEALKADSGVAEDEEQLKRDEYKSLRNLVLKSATNIIRAEETFSKTLTGSFFAEGEDGSYSESGFLSVDGTPYSISQLYRYQTSVINGLNTYRTELEAYINTGILEKDTETPVFGIDIGYNKSSFIYNDTEHTVIPSKVRITPERIGFYIDDNEMAYISKDNIYFPGAIIEGGSLSCSYGGSSVKIADGAVECFVDNVRYGTIKSYFDGNVDKTKPMMCLISDIENSAGVCILSDDSTWYLQYAVDQPGMVNFKYRHAFYGSIYIKNSVDISGFIYNKGYTLLGVNSSGNVQIGSQSRDGHTFIYSGENKDVRLYGKNVYLSATQYIYVPAGVGMLFRTSSSESYAQGIYCGTVQSRVGLHVGIDSMGLFLHGDVMLASGAAVSSDRRLKKDINGLDERYEKLFDLLEPKSFRYRMYSQKEHTGFIAQDVAAALSDSGFDAESAGSFVGIRTTTGEEFALVYEEFIALNTFMIKKCLKRIEELEKIIKEKAV